MEGGREEWERKGEARGRWLYISVHTAVGAVRRGSQQTIASMRLCEFCRNVRVRGKVCESLCCCWRHAVFNNLGGQEARIPLFLFYPSNLQLFYDYKQPQLNTNVTEVQKNFNHFLPGLEKNLALLSLRLILHGRKSPPLFTLGYTYPPAEPPKLAVLG